MYLLSLLQSVAGRRVRLVTLVLAAIAPFTAFIAYQILDIRQQRVNEALQQAYQYVRIGSDDYEDTIAKARATLELVSQVGEATSGSVDACQQFLASLQRVRRWANGMWVVGEDGRVRCSTIPNAAGVDLSDRDEYRRAITSGGFSVSDFIVTELSPVPAAIATLPTRSNETGKHILLGVTLDLSWFDRLSTTVGERAGATILLFDSRGTLLSGYPAQKAFIGRNFASHSSVREMFKASQGQFEGVGLDGQRAYWGYVTLTGTSLRLAVNFERSLILAHVNHGTAQALAIYGLVALLMSALIWFAGNIFFAAPMRDLYDLLQATLENMDQGLIVVDKNDTVPICYRRAIELLDLPPELMQSRPKFEAIFALQRARGEFDNLANDVRVQLQPRVHGEMCNMYERKRPNGTVIEVRTVPLAGGGVVRTYTDVTARKEAERQLAKSEARYRDLADNSTDMIFKLDMRFVRQYVSPASIEILGYAPEELVGTKPVNMIHPDDASRVTEAYQALASGRDRTSVTNRIRHRDGRWLWVEAEMRLVRDPATGSPLCILGSLRNVSAHKEAEDKLVEANRMLENLANEDSLTGLANRRQFDRALRTEFGRARGSASALALVMIDVDWFKAYNDRYGHPAGDACLKAVAHAVQEHVKRSNDIAARFGGEEIAILLPNTELAGAKAVAERIRQAIGALKIEHAGAPCGVLSISAGVASIVPNGDCHHSDLVEHADRALYRAKNYGRDCVEVHGSGLVDRMESAAQGVDVPWRYGGH
jgi:diguanylate cyclase (GGDEF)-like protein/PAS domain S-box-containing protein